MGGTHLQQEDVRVHHGLAEMTLNIGHSLAFDLDPVSHPDTAHDLIKGRLTAERVLHEEGQGPGVG